MRLKEAIRIITEAKNKASELKAIYTQAQISGKNTDLGKLAAVQCKYNVSDKGLYEKIMNDTAILELIHNHYKSQSNDNLALQLTIIYIESQISGLDKDLGKLAALQFKHNVTDDGLFSKIMNSKIASEIIHQHYMDELLGY